MASPAHERPFFTRVELLTLVVLAAVFLWLTLRLPDERESGLPVNDANQLKSLGQIFEQYLIDHNGEFPSLEAEDGTWPVKFYKLVTDRKIFLSPFDSRRVTKDVTSPVSYGINRNLLGMNRQAFLSPDQLIVMAPLASSVNGSKPVFTATMATNAAVEPATTCGLFRNREYLNVLCADGHVAPLSYAEAVAGAASPEGRKHWDPKYEPTSP